MKKLELQDEKILEKLKKKEKLAAENLDAIQEMEKLEKIVNKNAGKIKMLDEKVRPKILEIVSKTTLNEYEELTRVFNDKGKWTMEFSDRMEEFKTNWENRKKQPKEKK
jgi:histidyl-tRNA synthetase